MSFFCLNADPCNCKTTGARKTTSKTRGCPCKTAKVHCTRLIYLVVARRTCRLVKTARAVFVFMPDLHSSSVNAFTAISRSRSITIQANPSMSSIPNFMFCAVAVVYSFSAAARTTAAASGHRKSTLIELQEETISEILQQTASVITEERL